MSQENVDLVAESLREFQAARRAAQPTAADFVWDLSTLKGWPERTEYVGPEGFNEFMAKWTEAYDEFEQRTEELIDAGDQNVVSILGQRGRPREANRGSISGSASSGRSTGGN
jgi:hypothetical protein